MLTNDEVKMIHTFMDGVRPPAGTMLAEVRDRALAILSRELSAGASGSEPAYLGASPDDLDELRKLADTWRRSDKDSEQAHVFARGAGRLLPKILSAIGSPPQKEGWRALAEIITNLRVSEREAHKRHREVQEDCTRHETEARAARAAAAALETQIAKAKVHVRLVLRYGQLSDVMLTELRHAWRALGGIVSSDEMKGDAGPEGGA